MNMPANVCKYTGRTSRQAKKIESNALKKSRNYFFGCGTQKTFGYSLQAAFSPV